MFPKYNKPKLPSMKGFESQLEKTADRHGTAIAGSSHVSYPGGAAAYPGKFEKPHTHKTPGKMMPPKPRSHKRF